jgi:hypothetical protein
MLPRAVLNLEWFTRRGYLAPRQQMQQAQHLARNVIAIPHSHLIALIYDGSMPITVLTGLLGSVLARILDDAIALTVMAFNLVQQRAAMITERNDVTLAFAAGTRYGREFAGATTAMANDMRDRPELAHRNLATDRLSRRYDFSEYGLQGKRLWRFLGQRNSLMHHYPNPAVADIGTAVVNTRARKVSVLLRTAKVEQELFCYG